MSMTHHKEDHFSDKSAEPGIFPDLPRPIMIAHRCGSGLGPENTCEALVQASFYRPHFYEIDIRHTLDGVAVCIHDETLDRTTSLSGKLADFSFDQIQSADAGSWFGEEFKNTRIPTLKRMVDCANPVPLAIEIKEADITRDRCIAIIETLNNANDGSSLILSFHNQVLELFHEIDPDRLICYLALTLDDYALEGGHEVVGLLYTSCDEEAVTKVHRAGKLIFVWTVDENYYPYIRMGVDGIVTNHPERLREFLAPG